MFGTRCLATLALALLASAGGGPAHADTTVDIWQMRNEVADSTFTRTTGCVTQEVYLFAADGVERVPQEPAVTYPVIGASLRLTDTCAGVTTFYSGLSDAVDFVLQGVNRATVTGSPALVDGATGETLTLTVDVTLERSSAATHGTGHAQIVLADGVFVSRARGAGAAATAVGSVIAPDGTDLIAGQTGTGTFLSSAHGTVQVTRYR
jgi:hypothetical protein